MIRTILPVLLLAVAAHAGAQPNADAPLRTLDACDVVWSTPSDSSFGSMPLGNGDVGANVWVEPSGDVLLYVSKVDAFDAKHLLPKLGRVRVQANPPFAVTPFEQRLVLRDGAITIRAGDANLRIWVDANHPVIQVEGRSDTPRDVTVSVETLRPFTAASAALPQNGTAAVLFEDDQPRLAWCYRNQSSDWAKRLASQNTPELVARTKDPILHRTSGCVLSGPSYTRARPDALRRTRARTFDFSVRVDSSQPPGLEQWLANVTRSPAAVWKAHQAWWRAFWDRSHVYVTQTGTGVYALDQYRYTQFAQGSKAYASRSRIPAERNARQITQRYALERFCQAAASRGAVPPPYNGSIFTMDMPAGAKAFMKPRPEAVNADVRDWAILSFMWQNTRHPYWSMTARGDYDLIAPGMRFVRDGLDIGRDRCRKLLGIDGAFIMEASWWHNVGVFDWNRVPAHLRFHQLASIELPAIMAEYVEHTGDRRFFNEVLLPCAEAGIAYYTNRFTQTDAQGRMLMPGVGCAETYQGVDNPCTEMGCLKYLLTKLVALDSDAKRRAHWDSLLRRLPPVPLRRIRDVELLAVGDRYDPARSICETPELYSVYPFRQVWIGNPRHLTTARQSFHVRTLSLDETNDEQSVETGGWQSAPVQAAYLGLAREAARLASINFNDEFIHWAENVDPDAPFPERPRARFPAFWETKMDGTPDNDHGANSVNTIQSMLLQSDGDAIHLLPAWPEDWNVSFKLRAAHNTTVEGVYENGRWARLEVTPASRLSNVVDWSTPERRIRTLVDVACGDRNHRFGLPPMLDGLPTPGPATRSWIERFGESVTGTRGGPVPNTTYRDRTLYVFSTGAPPAEPRLRVPATILSRTTLAHTSNSPVQILKLEYDRPIETIEREELYHGASWSSALPVTDGAIDLGTPRAFDRFEFTLALESHRRGNSLPYEVQVREENGSWRTVHKGAVFGNICARNLPLTTAREVRVKVAAPVKEIHLLRPAPSGGSS